MVLYNDIISVLIKSIEFTFTSLMNKAEVIEKMMNSENGGLYAAIGGIVLVYGIDRVTKSRYKVDARKESFTLAPAAVTDGPEEKPAEESEDQQG